MASAHQTVVALVEVVVVIVEVVHRYHAFTVVLVNLAVDAIRLDAGDVGVVLVAYLVGHELHHLVLDAVALSLLGGLFHVGAVLAEFFVLLLICRASAIQVFRQQTVHHRVGIAADGRREVRIVLECQTVVTDVVRRVLGFHHGAQGNGLDEFLLLLTLAAVHQCIQ